MNFLKDLQALLNYNIISFEQFSIKVYTVLAIAIIIVITKLVLWIIKKAMFRRKKLGKIDEGSAYALFQIIKYVIWIITIGLTLETIGVKLNVLIAGSAALMVGVGLGLQQTFNDIVSGIILLSERSIKVGDVLEIDGDVVKVHRIGLRTSAAYNRDHISIIIPNSLITTNKVINWSHQSTNTRFRVNVGVAYGSNVELVSKALVEAVHEHPSISKSDITEARLLDFNNSSLDFTVLFFSENIFEIERIKSDIRQTINRKFIEYGISIPFPQLDLHVKSEVPK